MTISLCCRFVPYDQWLVTHVDPSWKVKEAKVWFLKKCLHDPTQTSLDAVVNPPKNPHHRPPSPITFATDNKYRSISPIEFAPAQLPDRPPNPPEEADADDEDDPASEFLSLPKSVSRSDLTTSSQSPPPPPSTTRRLVPSTYNPDKLSLIRFSTGQVLEDDFTLEWYDIKPYELLEVHRTGIVVRLSRSNVNDYVQPYWEGWVRALRVILKPTAPGDPAIPPSDRTAKLNRTKTSDKRVIDRPQAQPQLEWRNRWLVIRHGSLCLCKDRMDNTPSQTLDLSCLTALRDVEHLRRSTTVLTTPHQRIVCAKFVPKIKEQPEPEPIQTIVTTVISAGSPPPSKPSRPKIKLKINPLPGFSKISSSQRRVYHSEPPYPHPGSGNPSTVTISKPDSTPRLEQSARLHKPPTRRPDGGPEDPDYPQSSDEDHDSDVLPVSQPLPEVEPSVESDSSSALSSPVFAHEGDESDGVDFDSEEESYRPGYSYGYRYSASVLAKKKQRPKEGEGLDPVSRFSKDEIGSTAWGEDTLPEKQSHGKEGEWVVLDMGDDNAFASLLRVLHRQCPPPVSSTFMAALPSLSSTPMPPPSPTMRSHQSAQSLSSCAPSFIPDDSLSQTTSQTFTSSTEDILANIGPTDMKSYKFQHPISLAVAHKLSNTFGALPYPEWRTQISERARKAGIGQVSKAMETFLFGSTISLHSPRGKRSKRRSTYSPAVDRTPDSSVTVDETDSGEESSEAEWSGWLGDLPRQGQTSKDRHLQEQHNPSIYDETSESIVPPLVMFAETQAEAQRRFVEDKRALEPSGMVMRLSLRDKPPQVAIEDTTQRLDRSPRIPTFFPSHSRTVSLTPTPTGSTTEEWAASLASSSAPGLVPFRRPSMPIIADIGNAGLMSYAVGPPTGSGTQASSQPRSTILMHATSNRSLNSTSFPVGPNDPTMVNVRAANTLPKRRASTAGLIGATIGSMGRATLDKSSERPRLVIPAASPTSSRATSPTTSVRRMIRRVRSGSSIKADGDDTSSVVDNDAAPSKKKKGGIVRGVSARAKIMRGLDSAVDFVDGR